MLLACAALTASVAACGPPAPKRAAANTAVAPDEDRRPRVVLLTLSSGRRVRLTDWYNPDDCHGCSGELRIAYFDAHGSFSADVEALDGGGWGTPPSWEVRRDLEPDPVLQVTTGGTHQGCTSSEITLVRLGALEPIQMANFNDAYENTGSRPPDPGYTSKVVAEPQGFKVVYSGHPSATVHYRREGSHYTASRKLKLEAC